MDGWLIAGLVWGSGRKIEGRVVVVPPGVRDGGCHALIAL